MAQNPTHKTPRKTRVVLPMMYDDDFDDDGGDDDDGKDEGCVGEGNDTMVSRVQFQDSRQCPIGS